MVPGKRVNLQRGIPKQQRVRECKLTPGERRVKRGLSDGNNKGVSSSALFKELTSASSQVGYVKG
jgi:hypothetical protein